MLTERINKYRTRKRKKENRGHQKNSSHCFVSAYKRISFSNHLLLTKKKKRLEKKTKMTGVWGREVAAQVRDRFRNKWEKKIHALSIAVKKEERGWWAVFLCCGRMIPIYFFLFVRLISTFETQEKICKLDFPTDLREKASIAWFLLRFALFSFCYFMSQDGCIESCTGTTLHQWRSAQ